MKKFIYTLLFQCSFLVMTAQNNPPWERPLKIAQSVDGTIFTNETIFQDSSGVPSAIRWKGDTLVCAFQWFRTPVGSLSWDRVAVKFSYDNGISWTNPVPIVVNGIPQNYQRPFDPTLARLNNDSIRIYFSSSDGIPPLGLDSTINTYSALSTDGINYNFEPGARFDHPTNKAIDPAVLFFNGLWHYSCPIGAPQAGAFHATSPDGITFSQQANYPSDAFHNWTGNMLYENATLMKFYGSGPLMWHNGTQDGFAWSGYVNTNLNGGDPTVVKVSPTNYIIIFTGPPYSTGFNDTDPSQPISIYPQPATTFLSFRGLSPGNYRYKIYDSMAKLIQSGVLEDHNLITLEKLREGYHVIELEDAKMNKTVLPFLKLQ